MPFLQLNLNPKSLNILDSSWSKLPNLLVSGVEYSSNDELLVLFTVIAAIYICKSSISLSALKAAIYLCESSISLSALKAAIYLCKSSIILCESAFTLSKSSIFRCC